VFGSASGVSPGAFAAAVGVVVGNGGGGGGAGAGGFVHADVKRKMVKNKMGIMDFFIVGFYSDQ